MYSKEERASIKDLYSQLNSVRKTAEKAGVCLQTVHRIINEEKNSVGKKIGRPRKLDRHDRLRIKKYVISQLNEGRIVSTNDVKENLNLKESPNTIRRELNAMGFYFDYIIKQLPLTKENKQKRVAFAKKNILERVDIYNIVFSDEKRFCLDGPDNMGSLYYKGFKSNIGPSRKKRQASGGGVMILGAITSKGSLKIKILKGRYNSEKYYNDLKDTFFTWCNDQFLHNNWVWQHDNCKIHTAGVIKNLFSEFGINVLEWPSSSPDINIIENVWSMMNSIVYKDKQYKSKEELIEAIYNAAEKISKEKIINLYDSFQNRMIKLIESKGEKIDY